MRIYSKFLFGFLGEFGVLHVPLVKIKNFFLPQLNIIVVVVVVIIIISNNNYYYYNNSNHNYYNI